MTMVIKHKAKPAVVILLFVILLCIVFAIIPMVCATIAHHKPQDASIVMQQVEPQPTASEIRTNFSIDMSSLDTALTKSPTKILASAAADMMVVYGAGAAIQALRR